MTASIEETLLSWIHTECLSRADSVPLDTDTNLFEAGIVDSAGLISFICYIETIYGLTIPDEDLLPENFLTVALIASYIRTHTAVDHAYAHKMSRLGPG